jgi:hypothetical protein
MDLIPTRYLVRIQIGIHLVEFLVEIGSFDVQIVNSEQLAELELDFI